MSYPLCAIATIAFLTAACGGGEGTKTPFLMKDTDTKKSDGGLPQQVETQDPLAPIVTILDPSPAADPNTDAVITSETLAVRCTVTKSLERRARDVDQSSVTIVAQWIDKDEKQQSVAAAVKAVSETEYEGMLTLASLPNGPVRFRCTAKDLFLSGTPVMGWSNVDTFLDLGPEVEILEPKEGAIQALATPVVVKFRVAPAKVSDADLEADVVDLKVMVGLQEFDTMPTDNDPTLYTSTIPFGDPKLFEMAPATAQITVSARSSRTPEPGRKSARINIKLDGEGPTIRITAPKDQQIVRGEVTLVAEITDDSGVDARSVRATVNRVALTDWKISGSTYTHVFDTLAFGTELTQLTINVRAADTVGNDNKDGGTIVLQLDNVPPLVSLDPPLMREWKEESMNLICSAPLDPVGENAVNDEQVALAAAYYRAFVWDETNHTDGSETDYVAGVEDSTMELYAQVPSIPLLIDTNGDDNCDEINQNTATPSAVPQKVRLKPIAVGGAPYYPPVGPDNPSRAGCGAGTATAPPEPICELTSDLYRSMPQPLVGSPRPALFGLDPDPGGECGGRAWTPAQVLGVTGWVCLAARVEDTIGNVGVSPPLRVCYPENGQTSCPAEKPSCTDGCNVVRDMRDLPEPLFKAR